MRDMLIGDHRSRNAKHAPRVSNRHNVQAIQSRRGIENSCCKHVRRIGMCVRDLNHLNQVGLRVTRIDSPEWK